MHASTQMTIHNIPGVKWASKFGFKRVILARELGISEVEEIRKESNNIEIEIFGHGASMLLLFGTVSIVFIYRWKKWK